MPRYPREDGERNPRSNNPRTAEIPFRDADPDSGEKPLDDIDTFVVPARDERGASEPVTCHMPPYLVRFLDIVMRSNRFPYLRRTDFIRHAIYRHLKFLVSIRSSVPSHIVPALDAVSELCREDELRVRVEEVFGRLESRISFHMGRGDHMEAIRLLNLVKTRVIGIQDSNWKRVFMDDFWKRYGDYLHGVALRDTRKQEAAAAAAVNGATDGDVDGLRRQ